jgi:hypothetical protein
MKTTWHPIRPAGLTAVAELMLLDGVTADARPRLTTNGITTLGTVQASKTVTANASGDVLFPDGDKAIFGTGSDLQIYHDGADNVIKMTTGNLYVQSNGGTMLLQPTAGEQGIAIYPNSTVNLYYDNALKLATTATGIDVTGSYDYRRYATSADLISETTTKPSLVLAMTCRFIMMVRIVISATKVRAVKNILLLTWK